MAATNSEEPDEYSRDISSRISPWARGDHLRYVETEVLIPKIVRERAMANCNDLVKAFSQCAKGRTVSVVWACRKENQAMKDCLTSYYQNKDFFEECKQEYLKKREDFQKDYVQSGETKDMKKKDSVIL